MRIVLVCNIYSRYLQIYILENKEIALAAYKSIYIKRYTKPSITKT